MCQWQLLCWAVPFWNFGDFSSLLFNFTEKFYDFWCLWVKEEHVCFSLGLGISWFRCNNKMEVEHGMFLTSKERSNCFWINQLSEKSPCQSLAERIIFSVAFFGCSNVQAGHLLLILVTAVQPVFQWVFFSVALQVVKLCMTISFCYQIFEL